MSVLPLSLLSLFSGSLRGVSQRDLSRASHSMGALPLSLLSLFSGSLRGVSQRGLSRASLSMGVSRGSARAPALSSNADRPLVTQAYAALHKGARLELINITLPALTSTQVQIDISHCGLCHTDVHMVHNDWGISDFPQVPGHEGVGTVVGLGNSVRGLALGDTVGVGWMRDSCGVCDMCGHGRENFCASGYKGTYLGDSADIWGRSGNNLFGCFSKTMRIEAKFALKLPENLPPSIACPLMCAGGTVYEPIVDYVRPGVVVGVGSIGGLGTLALKLAKLHGGRVVAFSGSERKREGALHAGADVFVNTKDEAQMASAPRVDVFLDTCPVNRELSTVLPLLKLNGVYVRMGIPPAGSQSFRGDWATLIFTGKKIAGSIVTGVARAQQLLRLASEHSEFVQDLAENSKVELRPFAEVNEAMASLTANQSSAFRTVLFW